MTQDEIIEMARQAGMAAGLFHSSTGEVLVLDSEIKHLEAFAKLVAAKEREEILAMSAKQWFKSQYDQDEAIRTRGEA